MCVVSNIGDDWSKRWPNNPVNPQVSPQFYPDPSLVTRFEFEALKREMEELKKLLLAAKAYDQATGQPDCHMDEKVSLIKKIAQAVGVDMEEVFK